MANPRKSNTKKGCACWTSGGHREEAETEGQVMHYLIMLEQTEAGFIVMVVASTI
jgi:hypothetical protein